MLAYNNSQNTMNKRDHKHKEHGHCSDGQKLSHFFVTTGFVSDSFTANQVTTDLTTMNDVYDIMVVNVWHRW